MGLLTTQRMKDKSLNDLTQLNQRKAGLASVEFNYENFDGGMTSLKDLKGKGDIYRCMGDLVWTLSYRRCQI